MALQVNNLTGFETQGDEEASSSGSTTYETTNQRTGDSALSLNSTSDVFELPWVTSVTDAGADYVVGFALRKDTNPSSSGNIVRVRDDGNAQIIGVRFLTTGKLELRNSVGTIIDESAAALNDNRWYFIEIYGAFDSDPGAWEWFIDGVTEGSGTTDLDGANAFGSSASNVLFTGVAGSVILFDDAYILSGATAASDRYGDFAVKANQSTDVGDTDQGDTLANGTWALVSETPGNSGTSNDAFYQDTGNLTGSTITDGGDRAGPSGDSDITGATIKGAKFVSNLKRSTGGGRVHTILHGNDADGVTATADLGLTVDYITYEVLSESAFIVPTASESFQIGFSKSATAGQDIFCGDQWAMLGYVPAAVASPIINLVMAPYTPT